MSLYFETKYLSPFVTDQALEPLLKEARLKTESMHQGTCLGAEMLGWRTLPLDFDREEFARIKLTGKKIRETSSALIVIGIGGSYLGARAALEFLGSRYRNDFAKLKIYFIGTSLCPESLSNILTICGREQNISLNVVSKSGTTTEPAIAFRFLKDYMEKRYGKEEAARRIYVTTDSQKGTLHDTALREGYEMFSIPGNVGGRYSVLTAVGLLPVAAAGFDVDLLMGGARDAQQLYDQVDNNDSNKYAAIRQYLYRTGKSVELFTCCDSSLTIFNSWLRQLFGESEGKDGMGLYPDAILFSTDMHSMGQYIQEGRRVMFETAVVFKEGRKDLRLSYQEDNSDNLNYLAGRSLFEVNRIAIEAALEAHNSGGVPCMLVQADKPDEYHLGQLVYFFEHACAVSALISGVNPFNQPGVEAYKTNMFRLLGKPGF